MGRKKRKVSLNIFKIFFGSVKIYFLYLDKFVKYLMFPVLGQFLGLILMFTVAYLFRTNYDILQAKIPFMATEKNFLIVYCCCIAPFFAISLKAFYEYIIAFSSLNSVCYIISAKKKVQNIDFSTHDNAIERRLFKYAILLFLISILCLIAIIPVTWLFVPYLILVFQVFALEQSAGPFSSISRSIMLVKEHYFVTLIAILLSALLTYYLIPNLFVWAFEYFKISAFLSAPVEKFVSLLPINYEELNSFLKTLYIDYRFDVKNTSLSLVNTTIYSIFVMFMLPLRCCVFTNLYAALDIDAIGKNAHNEENEEE